ncbi:metal ABC transporter ATP-binding protein [Psychrobacter lutiphocae]|uniref:metal ABC transporter ATP-binding protein n=1 Tax=Psychrobacter lutiphocae TaxID=540500 RepID=UPI0003AA3210|nr:metal ABC transporter ATP-binding protein [Psychrobacter lutiphocae]
MTLDSIGYQVSGHSNVGRHTWCSRVNWLSGARSAQQKNGQHKSHTKHSYTSDASTPQKVLLTNINLKIMPNEKISVIGPNGAGKSTLMKLMLGLISPTSGRISCHPDLKVGYVPQKFSIPPILPLRVQDLLAQTKSRLSTDELDFLYQYLSISPLLAKQVIHLSGGETQRVLLARSFLAKPNLLILDEPMQGLDPESERWLYEFIDDLPDFLQCAMVVVSHDLHWVMRGSRRVICLNKHICCEGQPSTIGTSQEFQKLFGHQYVQPYIHQPHHCQHLDPHLH